jgi:hypothetical protein
VPVANRVRIRGLPRRSCVFVAIWRGLSGCEAGGGTLTASRIVYPIHNQKSLFDSCLEYATRRKHDDEADFK